MTDEDGICQVFEVLKPVLDERMRRLVAAALAKSLGHGGVSRIARVTGIARSTIDRGLADLEELAQHPGVPPADQPIRRPGGGRKPLTATDPTLLADLEAMVEPSTRGDPESPLRWTILSTRQLAAALKQQNHAVSHQKVAELLKSLDYSLQGNCKTDEGKSHPDRNDQFEHINEQAKTFFAVGQPVVSIDAKKKELVGPYQNHGRDWRPKGDPQRVRVYDFVDQDLGKVTPYGVYDLSANEGWVSVGMDHDTAEFAGAALCRWWWKMGHLRYPEATDLLVTADGGGSNASRSRLFKVALQRAADEIGLRIWVCHFPPGTSKWNKIEHKLFSAISQNWQGRPLVSHEVIVSLIASTTNRGGLRVQAELDPKRYPTGKKVSDTELDSMRLYEHTFHGEWNYLVVPHTQLIEACIS